MKVRIKKATVWDVDTIKEIEAKSDYKWSKEFDLKTHAIGLLKDPKEHVHILYRGEMAVGYISIREFSYSAEVSHVAIVKRFQGRGYGRRLLMFAVRKARALGKEKLGLSVRNYNFGAVRLYTSLGFMVIRVIKQQVNNRPFLKLVMEKEL